MFNFMRQSAPAPSIADVIAQVANGEMILIDIRDHGEVAMTGKAAGALHIPLMQLSMKADPRHPDYIPELKPDTPIGLYCASGARSGMAANMLQKLGYTQVLNVGGFGHWAAAGGPCSR